MNSDDEILAVAREGFLDEAKDMLRQFEEALLAMEQDPGDSEAVNCAFRAAHTIKGTAGLFGFEAVVHFTHEVESLLECMRSGQIALSDQGMALLLQGRDQMEQLLAEVGRDEADPAVAQLSDSLGAQLRAHRGAAGSAADAHAPAASATSAAAGAVPMAQRLGTFPFAWVKTLCVMAWTQCPSSGTWVRSVRWWAFRSSQKPCPI